MLPHCTILGSVASLAKLELVSLDLSGDSWIRLSLLQEISKFKHLVEFRMGHFEHSDCDCYSVVSKESLYADLSLEACQVIQVFSEQNSFPSLRKLWLEKNCELTPLIQKGLQKS